MKKFASYLVPSLIASLLMSMYAIVDGIFVGQKIGDSGLAAINLTWPITAFLQSVGTAFGLAGGICIQKYLGKNQEEHANQFKLTVILILIGLGILFGFFFYLIRTPLIWSLGATEQSFSYAISYLKIILMGSVFQMLGMALIPLLKNSKKVKLAAVASLSSILTNFILDYVFIFPLHMDLAGAALASVLAQVVSCFICLIAYIKELKSLTFRKKDILDLIKTSLAPFILAYSYSIVIIITNLVCNAFGGDEAIASYTLLSYLSYILIALACAVGDSIQPLFSYNQAQKEYKENKKMLIYCYLISFSICFIVSGIMLICKKPLGELYNLSDTAFLYYTDGLPYYILGALFVSFIKVTASYFYAIDSKLFSNIIVFLEPFFLTPIGFLIFCFPLKLYGVWVAYIFVQVSLFLISGGLILYKQKKLFQELPSSIN